MKKATDIEKKLAEKQDKAWEKACTKNQTSLNIKKLAINNRQVVGTFKDIFSDPSIAIGKLKKLAKENIEKIAIKETLLAVWHTFSDKKKNQAQVLAVRLLSKTLLSKSSKQSKPPTPQPVIMKLIWPSK